MMFVLLGISILLAALLALNSVSSLVLAGVWRIAGGVTARWSAVARARILFLLRIVPATSALALVASFLTPAYLAYEPRTTGEGVSLKLALLATVSLIGISLALFRSLASWRATARLTADWMQNAERMIMPGIDIRAFCFEHAFPIIAIVGVIRPKLFIARRVLESLSPDEIAAAIAHECGHLAAGDNLKRGSLRACRDALLIIPCGRALDRAWAEASECAADEYAAQEGRKIALDLASALVKIARMIPSGMQPTMPAGAFLVGDDVSGVRVRVRRLIEIASGDLNSEARYSIVSKVAIWAFAGFLFLLILTTHSNPQVLTKTHSLIESVVSVLS